MLFQRIDISTWKRKEYYEHYLSGVPCTYSVTVKLDITRLRAAGGKLYPTMLFCLSKIANRYEEFRMALNDCGELGFYDLINPCYTIFHKESETFSNIWTEYSGDYLTFCEKYEQDLAKYGMVDKMMAKPDLPENTFPVSMLPWLSFEGFNLNLQKGYAYLLPIFTIGKYHYERERCLLPLSVQVHHAVCDGFHVARFINELQELLNGSDLLE